MNRYNTAWFCLTLMLFASVTARSQKSNDLFESVYGGFSIALPSPTELVAIGPNEVSHGGIRFVWKVKSFPFAISFTDRIKPITDPVEELKEGVARLRRLASTKGDFIVEERKLKVDGYPGIEFRVQSKTGFRMLTRQIVVGDRTYSLFSDGYDKSLIPILDTFKIVDRQALIERKISDSKLPQLAQSPIPNGSLPEFDEDGLKGKVRKVIEQSEETDERGAGIRRETRTITEFNSSGFRTTRIDFSAELPESMTVYGFVDGRRVSNSAKIEFDDVSLLSKERKSSRQIKSDSNRAYELSLERLYENGALIELKRLRPSGSTDMTTVYSKDRKSRETKVFSPSGKIERRVIEKLDHRGLVLEMMVFESSGDKYTIRAVYNYDIFDDHGNWTKRTKTSFLIIGQGEKKQPAIIEYRVFDYFE